MSSDYFDVSTLLIPEYSLAESSDVNDGLNATDVGFQMLPQPRSDALQSGKKGFIESFTIADVTNKDNPISYRQWQSLELNNATDTGTANNYEMDLTPACTEYINGMQLKLIPANTNTSASCTLSLNGLPAVTIRRYDGNDIIAGDISASGIYLVFYYNSAFYINGEFLNHGIINDNTVSAAGWITINTTGSGPFNYEITTGLEQSDWNETDTSSGAYIKNKIDIKKAMLW